MRLRATRLPLLVCVLASAAAWSAPSWNADPARSRLTFVATQAGGEFEGRFTRFSPAIVFDPADLAHSRFAVDVDLTGIDTGESDRDNTLKGKDFFAIERWPKARFESVSFRSTGADSYEATGRLTLRNVTRDVLVPFTFRPGADGKSAVLAGSASVKRLDFGVGQGEWADTEWVGNEVRIRFELGLHR